MKRIFSIVAVWVAAMLSLTFTCIPHHHHHDLMFCLMLDAHGHAEEDAAHSEDNDGSTCVIELNLTVSPGNSELKCRPICVESDPRTSFIGLPVGNTHIPAPFISTFRRIYPPPLLSFRWTGVYCACGLRAPPVFS